MEARTLVIIPKGTLTNRVLVMVSAIVLCKHLKMDIKLIWDHAVPYDVLFLNNIDIVEVSYFVGKNYQYNPNINQADIYNRLLFNEGSDMHAIIESEDELKHTTMSDVDYILSRNEVYLCMLRESMNGMLLGQINLIDVPSIPYCIVNGTRETKMKQLEVNKDCFDFKNKELLSYTLALIYSRATVLLNTSEDLCDEFVEASKISMVPVVNIKKMDYNYFIENKSEGLLGYELVINPDMTRISLL